MVGAIPYNPITDALGTNGVQGVQALQNAIGNAQVAAENAGTTVTFPSNTVTFGNPNELIYNIGMVKDNYFWYPSNSVNKFGDQSTVAPLSNMPTTVATPNDLWAKGGGHKGMIARHVFPGGFSFNAQFDANGSQQGQQISGHRYGFQFHYNPTTISMAYTGVSDVDPMFLMSSANKFNTAAGVGLTQSAMSFDILLNRKPDFKYYDSAGHLKPEAPRDLYSPRQPSLAEQEAIYAKGTMYDVEYLLGTLVGFQMATQLRGTTTDIGFLIGAPIEAHLGKSLRYIGVVSSINVAHAFFDDRMVPTFTTVSISMSRMPDYPGQ
jgi:hypothetical protein